MKKHPKALRSSSPSAFQAGGRRRSPEAKTEGRKRESPSRKTVSKGKSAGRLMPLVDDEAAKEHRAQTNQTSCPIVGIGASAGGFEALMELLSELPTGTGLAYVIVQHLDPTHESKLAELLGRRSALPIAFIQNSVKVKQNHAYVLPPNKAVVLEDGRLRLMRRKGREIPPMPIDRFLRSLAEVQQDRAIGVVLSGSGTDGTLGLEAIKGAGGLTLAQDEASSKYFGMPGSAISALAVDFILSPKEIARQLARIARHPAMALEVRGKSGKPADRVSSWEKVMEKGAENLNEIFALLRARTGLDFSHYKHTTLKRRIVRRMVLHKIEHLAGYVEFLQANPSEVDALFNDLLINVTEFFRDVRAFQTLQKKVFPKLIKAHPDDSPLRMWVCGCSTGEEAYSLAMSLVEFFEKTRTHRTVQIFATDISDAGIEKARAGIYPESIVQDVSSERLRRFFSKGKGYYQVHKSIRDMCVFARQNLIVDPPFSNLDLITCRNVLIYLGPVLQRRIIPIFHYALRPTGFLMLGSSETIGASVDYFTLVNKRDKIYSKHVTFRRPALEIPHSPEPAELRESKPPLGGGILSAPEPRLPDLHQQVDRVLLREFSPAAVVINTRFEVLHFRGRTGPYLEHAPGAASLNLLKMVREGLALDVRTAVASVIKKDLSTQRRRIRFREGGRTREVTLEVTPFRLAPTTERLFLVVFREPALIDHGEPARDLQSSKGRGSRERGEIERVRMELNATKESLQAIIEEQEATNEELKSANEEIQSSNEELQSTNEELETAKEELQSTNEELTTLNEELQNRNNELTVLNNDLTNLLNNVNVAVLMLGNDLTIRRFTPMAERMFNLIPSDVGRRLSDMNRNILVPDLDKSIREVIDNLAGLDREVQDREGRWFSLRIRPYRTRENKIDGAVIMLVDVDEMKQALEGVMQIVKQPLITLGLDLKVKKANACFLRTFGLRPETVENRRLYEIGDGQWNIPKLHTLLEAVLPESRQVDDYEIQIQRSKREGQTLRIGARRFYENTRGMQMILLAMKVMDAE